MSYVAGKNFEKNEEIRIGGQICPLPVCLGLREYERCLLKFLGV